MAIELVTQYRFKIGERARELPVGHTEYVLMAAEQRFPTGMRVESPDSVVTWCEYPDATRTEFARYAETSYSEEGVNGARIRGLPSLNPLVKSRDIRWRS